MSHETHITAEQAAGYQRGSLPAGELRALDVHLAACAECRDALFARLGSEAQLSELRAQFSGHLTYEQVAALARGGASDAEAAAHLKECGDCRAEVEDLRTFRSELSGTPRQPLVMPVRPRRRGYGKWIAAAAVVVVVAGAALWNRPAPAPGAGAAVVAQKAPALVLSGEQQRAVDRAVATGELASAPVLDRLISRRGVLLGDGQESRSFDLSGPLGTAVVEDRPTLAWQPLRGATKYVVSVFDEDFRQVAVSPAVSETHWRPEAALARGRVYIWQVTATAGGETVRAPIPPAPEARFQVVPAEAAEEIEQLRREQPENHLALAVVLAKAGALDEAAAELDGLSRTDAELAGRLRRSLRKIPGR